MKNHSEYVDLFRQISSKHVLLQHSENWKEGNGQMHFARIIRSGSNPFDAMADIKEFIENYKEDLHFPCLLIETRLLNLQNKSAIEHQNNCSFFILDETGEVNDFASHELTITRTEQIALDVLGYLKELSKANQGIYFDENGAQVDAIATITDNIMGVRADFNLKVTRTACYDSSRFDGEAYDACDWFFKTLTAQQKACYDQLYKIEVDFIANTIEPEQYNEVSFSTEISGADLYFWEFGDGNISYMQNPTHIYEVVGFYDVTLIIIKSGKSGKSSKQEYISVLAATTPRGVEGLVQWLTADSVEIVSGKIDIINDLSGNDNHAQAVASNTRATLNVSNAAINNEKSITTDGTCRYTFPLITLNTYSIVAISKKRFQPTNGYGSMIYTKQLNTNRWFGKNIDSNWSPNLVQDSSLVFRTLGNNYEETNNWDLVSAIHNGFVSYSRIGDLTSSEFSSINRPFQSDSMFDYGGQGIYMYYSFDGDIAELMIYNKELTDEDWELLKAYTLGKYGI